MDESAQNQREFAEETASQVIQPRKKSPTVRRTLWWQA